MKIALEFPTTIYMRNHKGGHLADNSAVASAQVPLIVIPRKMEHEKVMSLRFVRWILLHFGIFVFLPIFAQSPSDDFTDPRDGETYKTVIMPDGKRWMAENLRYRTGLQNHIYGYKPVAGNITSPGTNLRTVYYCPGPGPFANSSNTTSTSQSDPLMCRHLGCLYPWWSAYADRSGSGVFSFAGQQGVCPDGWHLPSDGEWTVLSTALSDNFSSLQVLNAGRRDNTGVYVDHTTKAYFWTSSGSGTAAVSRSFSGGAITRNASQSASDALSVRCVEGDAAPIPKILFSKTAACSDDTIWATSGYISYTFNVNGVDQQATSKPYFFVNTSTAQTVSVKVKAKASDGAMSQYSDEISFIIYPKNIIITHPSGFSIKCGDTTSALEVIVAANSDANYLYQWQDSSNKGEPFADIPNANDATYYPSSLKKTTNYRVIITHAVCGAIYSNIAKVSVGTANPTISIQPKSDTVCIGEKPNALSVAVPENLSSRVAYQWFDGSTSIDGANTDTYEPAVPTAYKDYSCSITYSDGCPGSVKSSTARITVLNVAFKTHPVDGYVSFCTTTLKTTLVASGPAIQWQYSMDSVNWNNATTTEGIGPNALSFIVKPSMTTYYRCSISQAHCAAIGNVATLSSLAHIISYYPGVSVASTHAINAPGADVNGATGILTDDRDGKTYTTKKMPDGQWWMTKNLEVGNCLTGGAGSGWNSKVDETWGATSDQASNWNINGTALRGKCRQNGSSGCLYNWIAATQFPDGCGHGQDCPVDNWQGKWVQGICPAGWHLPIGGAIGDFNCMPASTTPSTWISTWLGEYGGYTTGSGTLVNSTVGAYYIVGNQSGASTFPGMSYSASSSRPDDSSSKNTGYSIRCIKNN